MIESGKVIFKANQDFSTPNPRIQRMCQYAGILPEPQLHSGPPGRDGNYTPHTPKHEAKTDGVSQLQKHNIQISKAKHLESILKISKAGRSKFIKNEQIDQIEHVIISSSFASVEITFFSLRMSIPWSYCQTNRSIVLSMCHLSTNEIDKGGRSIQT